MRMKTSESGGRRVLGRLLPALTLTLLLAVFSGPTCYAESGMSVNASGIPNRTPSVDPTQAGRNLYTGSVDVNVVNRLLAEPEFATLTLMIADYFDDTYATAHATQNQIHQCTAELFSRIAREDSQRRQKATSLSKQARAQCTPLYKTELAQMATQFEKTLKAIKKDLPDKASDAKTMTKQAFDHMVEELTKNGSAVDILSVKPEQIAESLCAYASVMDGVTDEMKENFYNAVLPLFHAGGSKVG